MKQTSAYLANIRCGARVQLLLFVLAAAWSCSTAAAEVYTWTDESGVVHYSDSPPESGASETLQVGEIYRPGSADAYAAPQEPPRAPEAEAGEAESAAPVSVAQQRRDKIAAEQAKRKEAQAETDRLCGLHRQRLEQMEPSRRVFYTDAQGETVRMDDEQRVSLVNESKAYLAANCGG